MSEICKSLINDYIAGTLNVTDFEEGLESIFVAMPNGHNEAQSHLQILYTNDTIDSNGFTQISQVISKVNIQSTLKKNQHTDMSYFDEDRTMHLTDVSATANDIDLISDDDQSGDKTVIVRAGGGLNDSDNTDPSMDFSGDISPLAPRIVEKPSMSPNHDNLGPGDRKSVV